MPTKTESLTQLFARHQGKVADKWQLYLDIYERLFTAYRDKPVRLLEIGVQNGGSLEIWAKYFPQAEAVIGCDLDPACAELEFDDSRISVLVGDVNNEEVQSLISAGTSEFDIIIDDGSHRSGDIIRSFALLFPKLALDGIYVIEDLHCSYWDAYEGGLHYPFSSIAFLKLLADVLNHSHWGLDEGTEAILAGINAIYDVDFKEESLQLIHSIEFMDSVCSIRKCQPGKNVLGNRVISGIHSTVFPAEELDSPSVAKSIVPSQQRNPWSNGDYPSPHGLFLKFHELHACKSWIAKLIETIDEREARIVELLATIDKQDEELRELKQSLSWRLTAPLRKLQISEPSDEVSLADSASDVVNLDSEEPSPAGDQNKQETSIKSAGLPNAASLVPEKLRKPTHPENRFVQSTRDLIKPLDSIRSPHTPLRASGRPPGSDPNDYTTWLERYDTLWDTDRDRIRHEIDRLSHKPLLSILILLETPDIRWLKQAVESIKNQLYDNWELCFGVNEPVDKTALKYLASLPGMNARIKSVSEIRGERTSTGWNRALEQCNGHWVVLLNQDDNLPEHALFHIVTAINDNPDVNLIYTDEDRIDHRGNRSAPYFKCDWNRDLLYSQNYVSHFSVYRREILEKIGGFRAGFEDAQDYDLTLRYIEQIDQGTIHHIPSVLCHRQGSPGRIETPDNLKAKSDETLRRALQEHFDRTGVAASVECSANGRRVHYALPDDCPLVSLIIPTRNKADLLKTCINSIETRTTYSNYEILVVDNGSDDPEALAYLDSLKNNTRIHVLRDTRPFNYAQLNNSAVDEARGELIGLINNDTEVIADEWLSEMVSIALQPGVGFVGAKLLFPDGTIQHAGVILGIRGVAAHVLKLAPGDSPGYFYRAEQINSFSALTGACLLIKKNVFYEAGGLDSENLAIAFNDIDLCLRVREMGYRNVYTPHALLYHHESASRGMEDTPEKKNRFANEVKFMKQRWGDQLLNDPAYSPNLTLESQDFSLAWPPRTVGPPY